MNIQTQKKDYYFAAGLAVLFLLLTLAIRDYTHLWGDDFAGYILEAQAIVRGNVRQLGADMVTLHPSMLREAALSDPPQLYYVWGLPMLLIPFVQNAADSIPEMFYQMKWINCLCISGIVGIGYLFFRRRFQAGLSFALSVMLGGSLFVMVNTINTDVPELFFALSSYYLYETAAAKSNKWILPVLLGIAMYCACAMRLNGFTVAAFIALALLADSIRQHRFRPALLLPFLVTGLLYAVQLYFLPKATSNLSDLQNGFSIQGFILSIRALVEVGYDILVVRTLPGNLLITGILGILALIGALRKGFRKELRYLFFLAATFLVLATLPYYNGSRYYMNTFPIVLLMVGYGAQEVMDWLKHRSVSRSVEIFLRSGALVFVTVCVLYCALFTRWEKAEIADNSFMNAAAPNCLSAYQYITDNVEDDAVIAFLKPRMLALATGRLAFTPTADRMALPEADYYLKPKGQDLEGEEAVSLVSVYENTDFILYQIEK